MSLWWVSNVIMVSAVYAESRGAKLKPDLSYLREMDTATLSQKCQNIWKIYVFCHWFDIFRRFQAMNDAQASFRRFLSLIRHFFGVFKQWTTLKQVFDVFCHWFDIFSTFSGDERCSGKFSTSNEVHHSRHHFLR